MTIFTKAIIIPSTTFSDGYVIAYSSSDGYWQSKNPATIAFVGQPGVGLFLTRAAIATGVLTSGSQSNTIVYTVPALPDGYGRAIITSIVLRLKTALVGAGSNALTVGSTNGGIDYILSKTITSATTTGTLYGLLFSDLGTNFVSTTGYNATVSAGGKVIVSLAVTGTVTTAPVFEIDVTGWTVGT